MITQIFIDIVAFLLAPVFSILPQGTLPFLATGQYTTATHAIGENLGGWDGLLPVVAMFEVLARTVSIILPALLLYKLINWIWKHIPDIAGFGPGSG